MKNNQILDGSLNEGTLFTGASQNALEVVRRLVADLDHAPVPYKFMEESRWIEILQKNPPQGNKIYITELLNRAHFASVASIIRAYRWAQGAESAHKEKLLLPFCASIRGLLEAASDSCETQKSIPITLAENHKLFSQILKGKSKELTICTELEDILIHFSHARRLSKEERDTLPSTHIAKPAKTYVSGLENQEPGGWYAWYEELCEYCHPAARSTSYMMMGIDSENSIFMPSTDDIHLEEIIKARSRHLEEILRLAFAPALLTLKVLSYFPASHLHAKFIEQLNFRDMPGWQKCAVIMKVKI